MKRTWTTRSGTKIRIRDMTTSHIRNAIALIRRWQRHIEGEAYVFAGGLQGEQAQLAMDDVLAGLEEEGFDALDGGRSGDFVEAFEAELERRERRLCGGRQEAP
jgi:hypothetical protein